MVGVESAHLHAVLTHHRTRPGLHHVEPERQAPDDRPQRVEQVLQPGRPHQQQLARTTPQAVRLEDARQPQEVVAVKVRQQDGVDVGETETRAQQLPLGALAAIDEPARTATRDECGRCAPRGARHGCRCTDECDLKIHALTLLGDAPQLGPGPGAAYGTDRHHR